VVHARLDARIAARKPEVQPPYPTAAMAACVVLLFATVVAGFAMQPWLALALILAAAAYRYDLERQTTSASLQMPLKHVGLQALALSITYALLVVAGLW